MLSSPILACIRVISTLTCSPALSSPKILAAPSRNRFFQSHDLVGMHIELLSQFGQRLVSFSAARAIFALSVAV
jgi:hypothetical protein